MYVIIADNIDDKETPAESIQREVMEEAGYTIESIKEIYTFYTSPGRSTEYMTLYYGEVKNDNKIDIGGGSEKNQSI